MVTLVVVWVFMSFKIVWFKKNAALDSYCAQAARDSTLEAQNYQEADCIILSCLCFVSCSFVKSENLRKQSILFFVTKLSLRRMYWKSHINFLVATNMFEWWRYQIFCWNVSVALYKLWYGSGAILWSANPIGDFNATDLCCITTCLKFWMVKTQSSVYLVAFFWRDWENLRHFGDGWMVQRLGLG